MLARRETQQNQRWQEESEDEQLERQTGFVACVVKHIVMIVTCSEYGDEDSFDEIRIQLLSLVGYVRNTATMHDRTNDRIQRR
jgi:hypothetical protein